MKILILLFLATTSCFALTPGEEAFLRLIDRDDCRVIPLWPGAGVAPNEKLSKISKESIDTSRENHPRIQHVMQPSIVVVPPPAGIKPTGVTLLFAPGGAFRSAMPNAQSACFDPVPRSSRLTLTRS